MYAVVVTVRIEPGRFDLARKSLQEDVVPRVSQAPGFAKGYWTVNEDSTQGLSLVAFATRRDAENALTMVRNSPTPPGVTVNSSEVREIVAEAAPQTI